MATSSSLNDIANALAADQENSVLQQKKLEAKNLLIESQERKEEIVDSEPKLTG